MSTDTSANPQTPTAQPQFIYPAYYPGNDDDEIDLFELVAALWRRRVFIISTTAVFALLAIVYVLFIATPVYEVKARLRQPADSSLVQLTNNGVLELSKAGALQRFQSELESRQLLRSVFDEAMAAANGSAPWSGQHLDDDLSQDQLFIKGFLPRLKVTTESGGKNEQLAEAAINIVFDAQEPEAASEVLQEIIMAADEQATEIAKAEYFASLDEQILQKQEQLRRNIASVKDQDLLEIARIEEQTAIRREELNNELGALKISATRQRLDNIERLKEAIAIADDLNIDDPVDFEDLQTQRSEADSNLSVHLDAGDRPLYFRGTKLLKSELKVLENRTDDEFMSPKIRDIQTELKTLEYNPRIEALKNRTDYLAFTEGAEELQSDIENLESLKTRSMDNVSFVRIDLPPIPPAVPVKPKKKLVVVAATVAGGMLAVIIALILNMRDTRRRQRELSD